MARQITLTDEQLAELQAKGLPLAIPGGGGREIIIQDGAAYRRMLRVLDELDIAESARICQERWEAMESGEDPGVPAREFLDQLKERLRQAG